MRVNKTAIIGAVLSLFSAYLSPADVPRLIHYQGKLRDSGGAAVNATASLRFRLYHGPTASTPVLLDETHASVAVANGLFGVLIGSQSGGVPDSALDAADVWLGVSVGGGPELSPRTRIVTNPYAVKSRSAEQLVRPDTFTAAVSVDSSGNVGVGTTTPTQTLDVAGTAQVTGFKMPTGAAAGKVLTSTDAAGVATWQAPTPEMPSGTAGQTLRHDGANWVANDLIYNDGADVGIGTTAPQAALDVARSSARIGQVEEVSSPGDGELIWEQSNNPSGGSDRAYGVAIDGTGVYIVGTQSGAGWRIEKRGLADGTLVGSFGSGGAVTSAGGSEAFGAAGNGSGLYVVGLGSGGGWRMEKRDLTSGALVGAFGSGGVVTSGGTELYDAAVDGTGLYAVGAQSGSGGQWRIEKRDLTNGGLIGAFGSGGVVSSDWSGNQDAARGAAVDATGLYVIGNDWTSGNGGWRMAKYDPSSGSLLWNQRKITAISGCDDYGFAVAIDATGAYFVGESNAAAGCNNTAMRIEKRNLSDGNLIASFGTGGVVSNTTTTNDITASVAVSGTNVYVAYGAPFGGDFEWRIERRDTTSGAVIWSQISDPSSGNDRARGVAADASGVYVVGDDETLGGSNHQWRMEKRDAVGGVTEVFVGVVVETDGKVGIGTETPAEKLDVVGNIKATGTITQGCSRLLKKDITALSAEEAMAAFDGLDPVKFRYRVEDGCKPHLGFIAEDVPDLVATPDRSGLSAMDVVAVLTRVVRHQQDELSQLRETVRRMNEELRCRRECGSGSNTGD